MVRHFFIVGQLLKLVVLTFDANRFSSDTGAETFRVVYIAGHYTFEGFVVANIMAHGVHIIITNQKCSAYVKGHNFWRIIPHDEKRAWDWPQYQKSYKILVLTGSLGQFAGQFHGKRPALWKVKLNLSFWNFWVLRFVYM